VLAVVAGAITLVVISTRDRGSWPGGSRVTAARLRQRLEASGLTIHWRRGHPGGDVRAIVAGIASIHGRHEVGFEFALAAGDHAVRGMLGHAGFPTDFRIPDNPCPHSPCNWVPPMWRPDDRGVLGNVAYGDYHFNRRENEDDQPTIYKLDDALFSSFAPDDPRAFPVLRKPYE
jgi:hypothetical protein